MKPSLTVVILLILILTACSPTQNTSETLTVIETVETLDTSIIAPTQAPEELPTATLEPTATEAPTNTPEPTAEPTPTATPDLGQQPYSTDFSSVDDWEVVLSKETTASSQENGGYVLQASGLTAAVVSSPRTIVKVSELRIEVDMTFAQTGDETGGGGIVCGYAWEKAFYGIGIEKLGEEYYATISQTTENSTLSSVSSIRLTDFMDQQNYHLQAICSSTGLGLIIDGSKVIRYPISEFRPGRIGLYSSGGSGINSDGTAMVDMPNTIVFDNFSATTMQPQDEWVNAPIDPFEFLSVGEVLYSEDFSAPTGSWSQFTDPGQTVKFENGKLSLTNTTDDSWVYSKLESQTWFNSGVMMETDVSIAPGSPELLYTGFLCDVDGNWNNLYAFDFSGKGNTRYMQYKNGNWSSLGSFDPPSGQSEWIESGRTYHLTGICGAGYLALLVDGVPEFFVPIPEQKFHSVGIEGGMAIGEEGVVTFLYDNFKITRIDPIDN